MKKIRIFIADLTHKRNNIMSTPVMPYNIGLIASYAIERFGELVLFIKSKFDGVLDQTRTNNRISHKFNFDIISWLSQKDRVNSLKYYNNNGLFIDFYYDKDQRDRRSILFSKYNNRRDLVLSYSHQQHLIYRKYDKVAKPATQRCFNISAPFLINRIILVKKQSEIVTYLRSYLNNEQLNNLSEEAFLSCKYLDLGYIDSFEIIHMIVDIERAFDITIDPSDTESDEFRNFKGLIEIIQSKM